MTTISSATSVLRSLPNVTTDKHTYDNRNSNMSTLSDYDSEVDVCYNSNSNFDSNLLNAPSEEKTAKKSCCSCLSKIFS